MFLFNKSAEKTIIKKDTIIWDYLRKIEKNQNDYRALYLGTSKLQNENMRAVQRQSLIETFEAVTKKYGGELFTLPNDDMVIIFIQKAREEILACLIKLRFILHDDPLIKNNLDMEKSGFATFFEISNGAEKFRKAIQKATEQENSHTTTGGPENNSPFSGL